MICDLFGFFHSQFFYRLANIVLIGCTNADFPVRVDRKCKVSVDEPANCLAMEGPD